MARLRKGVAVRDKERPYTRKSRKTSENYVKASPNNHIVKFDMGNPNEDFPVRVTLKTKDELQIRHNALEAGRKSANKLLEETLGTDNYRMRLRVYPHHILRENPMATGAGADRMSEGMTRAFGKPVGLAAQVDEGQLIIEAMVREKDKELAKKALKRFSHKIPCSCLIETEED